MATAGEDQMALLWNTTTGGILAQLRGHNAPITQVEFAFDGQSLVTLSNDRTAKVWRFDERSVGKEDLGTQTPFLGSLDNPTPPKGEFDPRQVRPVTFSSSEVMLDVTFSRSHLITAGADGLVKVWNPATGEDLSSLGGQESDLSQIVFSSDESRFAVARRDGTVQIWRDIAHADKFVTLANHDDAVVNLAFSPDENIWPRQAQTARVISIIWTFRDCLERLAGRLIVTCIGPSGIPMCGGMSLTAKPATINRPRHP